jgi:hypothetical protein
VTRPGEKEAREKRLPSCIGCKTAKWFIALHGKKK